MVEYLKNPVSSKTEVISTPSEMKDGAYMKATRDMRDGRTEYSYYRMQGGKRVEVFHRTEYWD